ncbi:putative O-glycosylation ligase, exosortase A system-associated [Aestuariispira ectoiniformans]|uniref:putative O-glycosylation ligase, exosortase A system-associated n=1 Tax=Aestuariispira ectoiniformans TaxID=2775080 RepID=UPI00223AEA17|nr:putative O-glycosylation ligase, exosortase A system-associated [Aestuariispira ectoiniformans]
MLRSLFLFAIVGMLLPLALRNAHAGLLLWEWFTVMSPHREVYGPATYFKFNLIVAVATLGMWLLSKEKKVPPLSPVVVLFLLFVFWMVLAQVFSLRPDYSWPYFDRFIRIMVFVWLMLAMTNTKYRIHSAVWVLVVSLAYFGVRGGGFTLLTGGGFRVWGPPQSSIEDNNHLGMALVMVVPLMHYLRTYSEKKIVRLALLVAMILTVMAVLGTQSRGAFVALSVMVLFFWWYSKQRVKLALLGGAVLAVAVFFMPESWFDRIATIGEATQDKSFMGRVDAWIIAFDTAVHNPLTGAGFRVPYLQEIADQFTTEYHKARAAHSIYFEVLGSMGFGGLFLFLGIALSVLIASLRVDRIARRLVDMEWASDLARMSRASFLSYFVGASSMSLEFWEGYWIQVALMVNLQTLVLEEKKRQEKAALAKEGDGLSSEERPGLTPEYSISRST